jgi:hypothetical protein
LPHLAIIIFFFCHQVSHLYHLVFRWSPDSNPRPRTMAQIVSLQHLPLDQGDSPYKAPLCCPKTFFRLIKHWQCFVKCFFPENWLLKHNFLSNIKVIGPYGTYTVPHRLNLFPMRPAIHPHLNFIKILHVRFLYESKFQSFSLITFGFVIFGAKISNEKCERKTLMKLTPGLLDGLMHRSALIRLQLSFIGHSCRADCFLKLNFHNLQNDLALR